MKLDIKMKLVAESSRKQNILIIPDPIDGTVIQHAINNVDACMHCA